MIALITESGAVLRNSESDLPLQPIHDPHRSLTGYLLNAVQAARYLLRYRPDVVISTGAGMTVPLFLLARFSGVTCVYVETGARISTPSMTGRILYPFASLFIVQNSALLPFYRKAVVASIL